MTQFTSTVRPPYDPEIEPVFKKMAAAATRLGPDTLEQARQAGAAAPRPDLTAGGAVVVTERQIPGPQGAPDRSITVLSPASGAAGLPCLYYMHGGGLVLGDRYMFLDEFVPWVAQSNAVLVSVSYRFAPEHPAPAQVEDCYAGLVWTAAHAAELGIDPDRLITLGVSAGGGLALGVALLARDRHGPAIAYQVLDAPMLDDRFELPSSRMLDGVPSDRNDYLWCWEAALGQERGGPEVSPYVAPGRATDLTGLPPTYLECGGAEGSRDEVLTMAMRLSQAGVPVDLHMWAGGNHGFHHLAPAAAVSRAARATRDEFIDRALRGHAAVR